MRPFYFGWLVVAAAILIYALILGCTFNSFGLYVLPVSREFGLSRADMNTGLIALNVGNAMIAPFIGRVLDKVPARRVMVVSALLLGSSLVLLGLSHSLWLNGMLMIFPVAIGVLGSGTISISIMIARWFSVYRGRAMALAAIGMALGSIFVTPSVGWLIENHGWRTSLIVSGLTIGVLLLTVVLFLRERPGPDDVEVRGGKAAQSSQTVVGNAAEVAPPRATDILRMPLFWTFALGVALGVGANQGMMVSLVPLALESGLSTMQGASLISVAGTAAIGSMLFAAVIADKVDRTILLSILMLTTILPCGLLLFTEGYVALLVTAALIGLSLSAIAPIYLALAADRFGLEAYGMVRGMMVPVVSLMGAVSIRFIGEVYDRTGDYDAGLWTYVLVEMIAAAMVLSTRPRRKRTTS